jgi:hypothetical protein
MPWGPMCCLSRVSHGIVIALRYCYEFHVDNIDQRGALPVPAYHARAGVSLNLSLYPGVVCAHTRQYVPRSPSCRSIPCHQTPAALQPVLLSTGGKELAPPVRC